MPKPNYAADVVPRTAGSNLRIATFNCENLFARPIAMNQSNYAKGQPYIDAYKKLSTIFNKAHYDATDKTDILEIMGKYELTATRPRNKFLEFQKIRGKLFAKKDGKIVVVANGRSDWVGG